MIGFCSKTVPNGHHRIYLTSGVQQVQCTGVSDSEIAPDTAVFAFPAEHGSAGAFVVWSEGGSNGSPMRLFEMWSSYGPGWFPHLKVSRGRTWWDWNSRFTSTLPKLLLKRNCINLFYSHFATGTPKALGYRFAVPLVVQHNSSLGGNGEQGGGVYQRCSCQ